MDNSEILERFRNFRIGQRGEHRARNKSLLALVAIADCLAGKPRINAVKQCRAALVQLLLEAAARS